MKIRYILLLILSGVSFGLLLGINSVEFSLINILLIIFTGVLILLTGFYIGVKSQYENTCK